MRLPARFLTSAPVVSAPPGWRISTVHVYAHLIPPVSLLPTPVCADRLMVSLHVRVQAPRDEEVGIGDAIAALAHTGGSELKAGEATSEPM